MQDSTQRKTSKSERFGTTAILALRAQVPSRCESIPCKRPRRATGAGRSCNTATTATAEYQRRSIFMIKVEKCTYRRKSVKAKQIGIMLVHSATATVCSLRTRGMLAGTKLYDRSI